MNILKSNEKISKLLVETGAYSDLKEPVILTSGELGIYYINTEKLCQDGGEFKKYGDNSNDMINHAVKMIKEHESFDNVIDILAEKVESLIPADKDRDDFVISGGQRRDWLFSGPVAVKLGLPHVSLYKDGRMEFLDPAGEIPRGFLGYHAIHVVDLITKGSSVYRNDGEEKGWVPILRRNKIAIGDLAAVVTRNQGGEEMLAEHNVNVYSFVSIDESFLRDHSNEPERALAYIRDPKTWSENYLKENGALTFVDAFNPDSGKLDRAGKFLEKYRGVLEEADKMKEFEENVQDKYGKPLKELVKGD